MPDLEIIRPRRETWLRRTLRSLTLGPFNPKDPTIARYFGGAPSSSGVSVNEESSLTYAAVWNAVVLIAGDVAKVPLTLYKNLDSGGKEPFRTHPLYELVHDQPNPEMSGFNFRRTLQGHALVWGNGYAEIERDATNRPVALWPLLPWDVSSFRDRNGALKYRVATPGGEDVILASSDMLHLSGFGLTGISGEPPIRKAMESVGLGLATEKFGATFFGNGSTFGGVISYPAGIGNNPQTRKENRDAIAAVHQGVERAHRFLALYEGASYQQLGIPPNHAQFLETRRFQIEEVARWFNLPVHKLKELARSTNNNIEHQGIEYATDTLQPWFRMWEGELRLKLIPRLERKQQFFEHITEALTRGDSAAQGELIAKQFAVGGITPNEIRSKFNMNPDPDGDDIYVPSNTMPADLARKYWEAQIDATTAKAEASRRPTPAPVVAPPSNDDEKKALREALELARKATQLAEDRMGMAEAALAEERAKRTADVDALAGEAERLRQSRDFFALDAHHSRTTLETTVGELGAVVFERDEAKTRAESLCSELAAAVEERLVLVAARVNAEGERDTARALVTQAEQERDEAKVAFKEMHDAACEWERQLTEAVAERDIVKAQAKDLCEIQDGLRAEAETLRTDLAAARAEIADELKRARAHRTRMLAEMRALFADATARLLAKECDRARSNQSTPDKLRAWVDRFYPLHEETVRNVFRPLAGPWSALTGGDAGELLDRLVQEHIAASTSALRLVVEMDGDDERTVTLARTLNRWEQERADSAADALLREGMASNG